MQKDGNKKYIRVPWGIFAYQWGVLVVLCALVFFRFDVFVFGLPIESFMISWFSFAVILVSTFVYIFIKDRGEE